MATNLSKEKRESLLKEIEQIRNFIQSNSKDINSLRLLTYLNNLASEVKEKKYGLIFEEHEEEIDRQLASNIPVLTEEEDLFINNGGQVNFLIEGDNLASLQLLEKTHRGKIDVIYIDPPYNRGNSANKDFMYDDDYVDINDEFKHSKWLSFMFKRIKLAKNLLTDEGVMFISIDEHEMENLKMLCNGIFSENNVEILIWRKNGKQGNTKKILRFKNTHEYIIVCYKNRDSKRIGKCKLYPNWKNEYPNLDNDPRGCFKAGNISLNEEKSRKTSPNYYTVTTPTGRKYTREWFISEKEFHKLDNDKMKTSDGNIVGRIYYPNKGDGVPALKIFKEEEQDYYFDSIIDEMGTFTDAKEELISLFKDRDAFDTPKPTKIIKELIRVSENKNKQDNLILDFFAGSGTTGQAVLELNKEDKKNRKFILCTNNQNSICRNITYNRLKTVITGKRDDNSTYSYGINGSLKYYKVDFIPVDEQEYYEYADQLLLHVRELVELENAVNLNNNPELAIVLNDDELFKFCDDIENNKSYKTLYLGHDVLLSRKQKDLFESNNISVKIIPEYYYPELDG